jgi:hypothetical protein
MYRYPKEPGVLDLLDVVEGRMPGWEIRVMCAFGFSRSLRPLSEKTLPFLKYVRSFVQGDYHPFVVCFPEDDDALCALRLVEQRFFSTLRTEVQEVRKEFSYVNESLGLSIHLGGIDYRKLLETRSERCPRAGPILTTDAYNKIIAEDPCAFLRALAYDLPAGFSV